MPFEGAKEDSNAWALSGAEVTGWTGSCQFPKGSPGASRSSLRIRRRKLPWAAMAYSRRTTMALALLLAVLSQPAWAIAHVAIHVAIHDHLAHHPHPPHPPHSPDATGATGATDGHGHETDPGDRHGVQSLDASTPRVVGPRLAGEEHRHDHDHLDATFVRPTRSADGASLAAIPAAGLRWTAPALQRLVCREGQPSRASPDPPDVSNPRAPPHA